MYSFFNGVQVVSFYHKYGDVCVSAGYLFCNTLILAHKINPKVPKVVVDISKLSLRYVGVLSLGTQLKSCSKAWEDLKDSIKEQDRRSLVVTACKVCVCASGIFFTSSWFSISLITLTTGVDLAFKFYQTTKKVALLVTTLNVFLDIEEFFHAKALLEKIKKHQKVLLISAKRLVYWSTWEKLKKDKTKDLSNFIEPLENKIWYVKENFALSVWGHLSMAIYRIYPDSLLQAVTTFATCFFYTAQKVHMLYRNQKTEQLIDAK